jgi:hypothetical protein
MNWRGDTKDIGAAVVDAVLNGHCLDTSHAGKGRHSPANSDLQGSILTSWCKTVVTGTSAASKTEMIPINWPAARDSSSDSVGEKGRLSVFNANGSEWEANLATV